MVTIRIKGQGFEHSCKPSAQHNNCEHFFFVRKSPFAVGKVDCSM